MCQSQNLNSYKIMDFPLISDRIAVNAAKALDNLVPNKSKDAYDKENKRNKVKDSLKMPPLPREKAFSVPQTGPLKQCDDIATDNIPKEVFVPVKQENKIIWQCVVFLTILHCVSLYGVYLAFTSAMWKTLLFVFPVYISSAFGVTAGAHRLWAHRAYKAKWPLKLILVLLQTLCYQNSVIWWVRDHRLHHKFQGTDADPYNAKRGFFFSHCGWLLSRKHSEVRIKGSTLDLSDLYAEPLLRFQHKYFWILMPIVCYMLPTVIPMVLWNESFTNAFCINVLRQLVGFHATALVNSAAHLWGAKPYDKHLNANESAFVSIFTAGEGWHNYHHAFPWDYKAAEFSRLNLTLPFINFFAKIGWAYDLKSASPEMVKRRVLRSGDGSHEIWGWGDKDQTPENYKCAIIYNKKDENKNK